MKCGKRSDRRAITKKTHLKFYKESKNDVYTYNWGDSGEMCADP